VTQLDLNPQRAARVRVEVTTNDGVTYEIELENCDKTAIGIDMDVSEPFTTDGVSMQRVGLDSGQLKLTAHGRFVKTERRQTGDRRG